MTIQTIPLSSLQPSNANPRTAMDPAGIEGLAASIQADGLLQNLVVRPLKGRKPRYCLISGERRYRALQLLLERGQIPADYAVPADIRAGLSGEDGLRLATVENVQRENLSPLDEAAAFARLIQQGAVIEDLSAQTGLSFTIIKRRLALASLCDEARQALASSAITLAQAEALTLGTQEAQCDLLERLASGYQYGADDIREILLDRRPTVAMARFPLQQYQGTLTTDLFAEDTATYFDDVEQFFILQRQAVAEMAEQYAAAAEWVEVTEHYNPPRWHYRSADAGETGGVVINLSPTGEVEVLEGLAHYQISRDTAQATADTPLAPAKPRPAYSVPLCRDMAYHKSMAVQHLLLSHPRKAREVAVLMLLGASDAYSSSVRTMPHGCLKAFSQCDEPPASYLAVEQEAQCFLPHLGISKDNPEDGAGWKHLVYQRESHVSLYEAIKALSDEDLERLHTLLIALCFGQGNCERLDTGETLFNRVARDLGADMRTYWRPDVEFLSRRSRVQLLAIAEESGLTARLGYPSTMKKAELVKALVREFRRAHEAEHPGEAERTARDWLPDALHFPAVDPTTVPAALVAQEEADKDLAA